MTPEAKKYIQQLFKEDPRKFFELNEDSITGITSAVLNEIALIPDEIDEIKYFIKNGSPSLTIEFRPDGLPLTIGTQRLFIDGKEIPGKVKLNLPGSVHDGIEFGVDFGKGDSIEVSFSEIEIKHIEWSYLTKKQLYQMLLGAESEEDYEECAEILKYAKSKGWDLKNE